MYKGFDLKLNEKLCDTYQNEYMKIARKQKGIHGCEVYNSIDSYLSSKGGVIDGDKLESDWFPQIECDIFLSHSHGDEEQALILAGMLQKKFGLTTFIDSSVWGYADDLLREIDNEMCRTSSGLYEYEKRNGTTSHVHMMLASAIGKMIDKTECLFFLNTPASLHVSQSVQKTHSVWIYYEIALSKIIRKQIPKRGKLSSKGETVNKSIEFSVEYSLDKEHLLPLSNKDLNVWRNLFVASQNHPLDVLYDFTKQKPLLP